MDMPQKKLLINHLIHLENSSISEEDLQLLNYYDLENMLGKNETKSIFNTYCKIIDNYSKTIELDDDSMQDIFKKIDSYRISPSTCSSFESLSKNIDNIDKNFDMKKLFENVERAKMTHAIISSYDEKIINSEIESNERKIMNNYLESSCSFDKYVTNVNGNVRLKLDSEIEKKQNKKIEELKKLLKNNEISSDEYESIEYAINDFYGSQIKKVNERNEIEKNNKAKNKENDIIDNDSKNDEAKNDDIFEKLSKVDSLQAIMILNEDINLASDERDYIKISYERRLNDINYCEKDNEFVKKQEIIKNIIQGINDGCFEENRKNFERQILNCKKFIAVNRDCAIEEYALRISELDIREVEAQYQLGMLSEDDYNKKMKEFTDDNELSNDDYLDAKKQLDYLFKSRIIKDNGPLTQDNTYDDRIFDEYYNRTIEIVESEIGKQLEEDERTL